MNKNELDDILPFGESERKKIPRVSTTNPLTEEDKRKDIEILTHK